MTNDPKPLINGLTRSETDASASVAGVSAASEELEVVAWEYGSGSFISNRAKEANRDSNWVGFYTKPLADHADAQSRIASLIDARDGWKLLAERSVDVVNSLTADLAEARAEHKKARRAMQQGVADITNSYEDRIVALEDEIVALKAAATAPRVPLTPSQIMAECPYSTQSCRGAYAAGAKFSERHHGISAIPGDDAKAVGGEAS